MNKTLQIVMSSLRLAFQELYKNKLRTFLSLFGVTIGIFCIIGVLSTVTSLEKNVQDGVKSLGSNTIYIDKWSYGGGGGGADYPWWKYASRPTPNISEARLLTDKVNADISVVFNFSANATVEHGSTNLEGVNYHGVTHDFDKIQPIEIVYGRYLTTQDFDNGSSNIVIGYDNAEKLFGNPEKAVGAEVKLKSRKARIAGVIKKQGKSLIGGWDFDNSIVLPVGFMKQMFDERFNQPKIIVKGPENMPTEALRGELKGAMRSIRRLGPKEEDDFELNAISDFSKAVDSLFGSVNLGGWLIGLLSLIVGAFGIANIMFVTVRERTPYIGLKKAIGAKKRTILLEFLLESSFICIIGGVIGLLLVILLTGILSKVFSFPISVSANILGLAFGICLVIGVLAGIIPAVIAARMDPVVAIRSK